MRLALGTLSVLKALETKWPPSRLRFLRGVPGRGGARQHPDMRVGIKITESPRTSSLPGQASPHLPLPPTSTLPTERSRWQRSDQMRHWPLNLA